MFKRSHVIPLLTTSLILGCTQLSSDQKNPIGPIRSDHEVTTHSTDLQLPTGRFEAFFEAYTGADVHDGGTPPQRTLILVTRYGNEEQRRVIANCGKEGATLGSALGGGTENHLEVAGCGTELWLETRDGTVSISSIDGDKKDPFFSMNLPDNIKVAVTPEGHN